MKQRILHTIFAGSAALGTLAMVTMANTEKVKQGVGGIFDHVNFTYEGQPKYTQSIAGDGVATANIPPVVVEAIETVGGSGPFDKAELRVRLFGDAQTKAVTVDITPPKVLHHQGDVSSPIVQGYSANWIANWMWATSDVKAGVAGNIEGIVYQDGKGRHFHIPLLIEAKASTNEWHAEVRTYYPLVATIRWGNVRWTDGKNKSVVHH